MDIKRSILFVALAIVSYALVLQWNKDYGQPELPAQTATFNQTEGLPDTSVPAGNAGPGPGQKRAPIPKPTVHGSSFSFSPVPAPATLSSGRACM